MIGLPNPYNDNSYFEAWHREIHEFLMKWLPEFTFVNEIPGGGCPKGYITVRTQGRFSHEIAYITMEPTKHYQYPTVAFRWFTSNKYKRLISEIIHTHSRATRY